MELVPDPSGLPIAEATPAGHAAAAAELGWKPCPLNAGFEYKQNASEGLSCRNTGAPALGPGRLGRDQWFDDRPEGVRKQCFAMISLYQLGF